MSAAEPDTASRASTSRVEDLDVEAESCRARGEELSAVLGDTAGLGGDEARATHLGAAELAGTDFERIEGARHGRLRQPPGLADALAETDDARESVDDTEAAARGAGEQQAAIVGAEVERAVNARGVRIAVGARSGSGAVGAAAVVSDRGKMGLMAGDKSPLLAPHLALRWRRPRRESPAQF